MSTGCRATWSTGRRPTPPSAPTRHFLPAATDRRWLYFKLWPNVAFDIYPDQVDFMHFLPVGADRDADPRDQLCAARRVGGR